MAILLMRIPDDLYAEMQERAGSQTVGEYIVAATREVMSREPHTRVLTASDGGQIKAEESARKRGW